MCQVFQTVNLYKSFSLTELCMYVCVLWGGENEANNYGYVLLCTLKHVFHIPTSYTQLKYTQPTVNHQIHKVL